MNWRRVFVLPLLAVGASLLADPPPPVLNSPVSGSTNSTVNPLAIFYSLPETPASGSVQLVFSNSVQVLTLHLADVVVASFLFDPHNPFNSPFVLAVDPSSGALPDGRYDVQLSYQDAATNLTASTTVTNVYLDFTTQPPILIAPADNAVVTSNSLLHIQYGLPESPASGSVQLSFQNPYTNIILTLDDKLTNDFIVDPRFLFGSTVIHSATALAVPDGNYTAKLQYQDVQQNPSDDVVDTNVLFQTQYGLQTSLIYTNGMFLLTFTNYGYNETYSYLSTTNLRTPLSNWDNLGTVTGATPGLFQFQDTRSNIPSAFYIIQYH